MTNTAPPTPPTHSPDDWFRLADDSDAVGGGAWGSWHRAMGHVQAAVDAVLTDAENGEGVVEQVERLEARLAEAIAELRAAAVAGQEEMEL